MQASPLPYHHFYHHPYHPAIQGPQDHELKKQYLALLPPQQIIDICLNFDLHVPHYVKSTVWPADINAAIAAMRNKASTSTPSSSEPTANSLPKPDASSSTTNDSAPPVSIEKPSDSLSQITDVNKTNGAQEPAEKQPDPQPPDKPSSSTPGPPEPAPIASLELPPPTPTASAVPPVQSSTSQPQPPQPAAQTQPPQPPQPQIQPPPQTQPQQPPYPQQPYGYPQAAYPHAPYYQHASGYPYPYPHWPGYPPHPHMQGAAGYPQQPPPSNPASPFTNAPQPTQPPDPYSMNNLAALNQGPGPAGPADDLPSYEEMIVEALTGCTDTEGCAPKDLFAWMAARYPLQQNFRPSASQALQKAYKRGRLEKSSGGKYRLNATWEGGTTSRRTTRRPQTQNQAAQPTNTISSSPFTHAPLVHHHQQNQQNAAQNNAGHPQYPFGYPYPGYPGYPPQGQQQLQQNPQTGAKTVPSASNNGSTAPANGGPSDDPYEAAQNILKAINFGGLLKLPPEDDGKAPSESGHDMSSPPLNGVLSPMMNAVAGPSNAAGTAPRSTSSGLTNGAIPVPEGNEMNTRAELQAQLVLLAAQLAELAQEDGEEPTTAGPIAPDVAPLIPGPTIQQPSGSLAQAGAPPPAAANTVVPQILPNPPSAPAPVHPHPPPMAALGPAIITPAEEEDSEEEDDDDMEEVI